MAHVRPLPSSRKPFSWYGGAALVLGIIGLAAPFVAERERRMPLALIVMFALLWYVVHESSPLKPYPDFARYMLPLVPLLGILASSFLFEMLARFDRRGIAAAVVILLAAAPALWTSVRINFPDDDPRSIVVPIVEATGARVATDRYADYNRTRKMVGAKSRPNTETTDIVMTSNLIYDRFDNYAAPQNPSPQSLAGYYRGLNALPHLEGSNGRPTMAYFNPVLRIVAIDGSMERLIQISAAIKAAAPGFKVELIEPKPHN